MPLPLLAFLDASGQTKALRQAVDKARVETEAPAVFCDRFTLSAILLAQGIFSRAARPDKKRWRAWIKQHEAHRVDVAIDASDPLPAIVHMLSEIHLGLKALPRFILATPRRSLAATGLLQKAST
jgi:D-aspartate ligase